MDKAIPAREVEAIHSVLNTLKKEGCDFHALRTRQAGRKHFADVHVVVPGAMSVREGHDLVERLEDEIAALVPNVEVLIHIEPLEDPRSWKDCIPTVVQKLANHRRQNPAIERS
jgi:divalent metal cation (Fe/Co/Zn/Cd) transporter